MPESKTREAARKDKREGKSASTQAGEYVKEEIEHIREGKHGARSAKQAIAIGLSKARADGIRVPAKKGAKQTTRAATKKTTKKSAARSAAAKKALKKEPRAAASKAALSRQATRAASKRSAASRSASAKKAASTRARNK